MNDSTKHKKRVAEALLTSHMMDALRGGFVNTDHITQHATAYMDAVKALGVGDAEAVIDAAAIYLKVVWMQRMQMSADAYDYANRFRNTPTTLVHATLLQRRAAQYWCDAQEARNMWIMNEKLREELPRDEEA